MADDSSALRGPIPDDISTLIRRRAQIRDDIARSCQDMQRLAAEFERVEAAIREMSSSDDVTPVTPAALETRSGMARIIFNALNEAEAPMTSRALATRVMEELDLDSGNGAVRKHVIRRVCVYLWEQAQKGRFRKVQPEATPLRWECVRSAL